MEKKKLNTLTKGLALIGILMILFSLFWHMLYPNKSQMWITLLQGVFILGFAYICQWTKNIRESCEELDDRINAMDIWMKTEFDKCSKKKIK